MPQPVLNARVLKCTTLVLDPAEAAVAGGGHAPD